ncbi:hypothetical protein MMC11_007809 [Xylographa trunciseda]|nr:hypothetical protein [Xylographa trunciseda]
MQSVQRRFGKLLPRTADESQVAVLLKDFEDADRMLAKLIDATKAWRDSWKDIFTIQQRLVDEFQGIYNPILGAGEGYSAHEPVLTPQHIVDRVVKLSEVYTELKTDMLEEVSLVDERIIKPATDARDYIHPMKKVIKKRQDRKLDFERYQGRYDAVQKKTSRTDRENNALLKHETDLSIAKKVGLHFLFSSKAAHQGESQKEKDTNRLSTGHLLLLLQLLPPQEYTVADEKLRATLPPIVTAAYSILPHLLNSQIMIQNTLVSQYYTLLHNFCEEEHYPSPPPPMSDVIAVWDEDFRPVQHEIETNIAPIATGKAIRIPMKQEDRPHGGTMTGLNIRNGFASRKASSQSVNNGLRPSVSPSISDHSGPPSPNPETKPSPNFETRPRISSVPSQTSLALSTPNYSNTSSPSPSELYTLHAPAGPRADYFSRDRIPSSSSVLSAQVAMKKKPPPPPPKKTPSSQDHWVTALYDFAGQGQGDLVFREGDRIKVVKKTDSKDDWWQGELKGVQGSFPANYC